MDLDLTMPPARGRRPADCVFGYLRNIDEADVVLLQAGVDLGSITPAIKKIRASHHQLASLLASGVKPVEAAMITGYSGSRISILCNDPAFKQLLNYYTDIRNNVNIDVLKRMNAIGVDILEEMHERVVDSPEAITNSELTDMGKLILDRAGYGPKSTVKHEMGLDQETLQKIKNAVDAERHGNVIEATAYKGPADGDRNTEPARIPQQEAENVLSSVEGTEVPEEGGEVSGEED